MNRSWACLVVAVSGSIFLPSRADAQTALEPAEQTSPARGEAIVTRARVLSMFLETPTARVAASEANVAKAEVTAAGVLSLENPVISGLGGIRYNPDGEKFFAATATLSWPVDLGGKRGSRIDAAEAQRRAADALKEQQNRQFLSSLLLQHALVLRDERQIDLAESRLSVTRRFLAAAERRRIAGSVPELDVTLASLQEKQDAAARAAAIGIRNGDNAMLFALLGMPAAGGSASGELVPEGDVPELPVLLADVAKRPDVLAARAAADSAAQVATRERKARIPTFNILAQYERDEGANIGQLGLAVPLPFLNANATNVARSTAEVDVAREHATAVEQQALGEIRRLHARYVATKEALDALRPSVALTARAVELSTRGYELGENDLASVLLVRREALAAQSALLEAEHAHANAKIELLIASGRLPQ